MSCIAWWLMSLCNWKCSQLLLNDIHTCHCLSNTYTKVVEMFPTVVIKHYALVDRRTCCIWQCARMNDKREQFVEGVVTWRGVSRVLAWRWHRAHCSTRTSYDCCSCHWQTWRHRIEHLLHACHTARRTNGTERNVVDKTENKRKKNKNNNSRTKVSWSHCLRRFIVLLLLLAKVSK